MVLHFRLFFCSSPLIRDPIGISERLIFHLMPMQEALMTRMFSSRAKSKPESVD